MCYNMGVRFHKPQPPMDSFCPELFLRDANSTKQRLAFYSPSAAEKCGTKIYKTPDGGEVEVTCVMVGLEDTGSYMWPDRVPVIVTSYLRDGWLPDDNGWIS